MSHAPHRRLSDSAMGPLRVTAWLQCGVISDNLMPLDAVLYYHLMREAYGPIGQTFSGGEHPVKNAAIQLPVKRHDGGTPQWFYACSFAQWPDALADGMDHWNQRMDWQHADLIDFGKRRGSVDVASGRYKSYHMPVFYRHSISVDWYAFGHAPSIERVLRFCTHLGKKTDQGWGAVLRWRVESAAEDWSVRGPDGRLMRAVPVASSQAEGHGGKWLLYGFRPSYWLPKNQAMCVMPGAGA